MNGRTKIGPYGRRLAPVTLAAVLVAAFAVAGCGGGDTGVAEAGGRVVKATLGDYTIKLDKSSVAAGDVRFEIENAGKVEHEFVVIKTSLAAGALPVADGEVNEDAVLKGEEPVEAEDIGPGASTVLEANLAAGKYAIICNLLGHYGHGMRVAFTVE
jgi:uncharacterized cupredoxin-like copper-binding protein